MEQRKLFFFYDGKLWKIISLLRLVSRITNAFLCLNYASRYANFASVLYKTNFLLKVFVFFTAIVNCAQALTLSRRVSWRISGTFQVTAQPRTLAEWSQRPTGRIRGDWWESKSRALPGIVKCLLKIFSVWKI